MRKTFTVAAACLAYVADDSYLYFSDMAGQVYRRRHCGGPPQLVAQLHGQQAAALDVYWMAELGNYLYWATQTAIYRMQVSDTPHGDAGADASLDASSEPDASATDAGVPDVSDGSE